MIYTYTEVVVTFGGETLPVESLQYEPHDEPTGVVGITPGQRHATMTVSQTVEQTEALTRRIHALMKRTKREKRLERAWYRRKARVWFREANRRGIRLEMSAAQMRRWLERERGR